MLARDENELLCRVGPETAMGKLLRRYWLPALMSSEVEAGGAPQRVRLLGENLVAFRDTTGRVGLLDENCPHRGASLVLARNEECGLRCLYHGWKIDVGGNVLETPPEPDELNFKDRVRAVAYPVRESGGLVWAYLGPVGTEPAPPAFDFTALPAAHTLVMKAYIGCNWVQSLEAVIDSVHTDYLHSTWLLRTAAAQPTSVFNTTSTLALDRPSQDRQPRMEAQNTPYGFRYAAIRRPTIDPETKQYVRVTLFIAPIFALFPAPAGWGNMQMFVPFDDENVMLYHVKYRYETPLTEAEREQHTAYHGLRVGIDLDAGFRPLGRRANNWLQDRELMRSGQSFTGIDGVNNEDVAVQESMGAVFDRSKEHLGTSDVAVIRMRRVMLDAVRRFAEGGAPLGLDGDVAYDRLRAEERIIPKEEPWQTVGAFAGEHTGAGA